MIRSGTVLFVLFCMVLTFWIPVASAKYGTNAKVIAPSDTSSAESQAWEILRYGASSQKTGQRMEAITALGTIRDSEAAARMVMPSLKDHNSQVRQLAAKELGEMNAVESIATLKEALNDPSNEVSFTAAVSLLQLGDGAGRRVLIDVASGKRSGSPGFVTSEERKMGKKMHDPAGMGVLVVGSGAGAVVPGAGVGAHLIGGLAKDHTSPVKIAAVNALACDGNPDTIRQLETTLTSHSHPAVRVAAARALGKAGNSQDIIAQLEPHLKDSDMGVRYMSAASIININNAQKSETDDPPAGCPHAGR